jgi:glycosyltransferase involved in cell wall biosynthesis
MAWPAFKSENPYNVRLAEEMAALGVRVREFSPRELLLRPPGVFHAHWPDIALNSAGAVRGTVRAAGLLAITAAARLRGTRVVWTVHNLQSHERPHPRLERLFWRLLLPMLSGFIALTEGGRAAALARFPVLRRRRGFVVPNGDYTGVYPDTVSALEARRALGLPAEAPVIGFLGQLRPYKNVPHLIRTFQRLPATDARLVIAGRPNSPATRHDVVDAARGDPRITLALEHVPDDRIQVYLRACDLVVLPFADVLNSGSALLALAFGRPVLVPRLGAMGELQQLAGDDWVRTYAGALTAAELSQALSWASETPRSRCTALDQLAWDLIAARTVDAYRALEPRQERA